ncbi:DEAD/DEAH box helicase, putative [Plasmodium ovale wallikeri]|uniref:DEAD/DEAH box helicase, putative n=2 Tax=Plasmodium ovale TaxID=36330 RepID=A0A1A8YPA9_PLAOA|nr:DEAD/DEAH box helicase, putative [Plasmodium ovale wallikeri]SBT33596.1 DEAD/DEAH box helicase, putative [Plasmodium ovale wallikeri]SBT76231.1 DEAD/DEAH box helicase, putative [Plasmodium ovale]
MKLANDDSKINILKGMKELRIAENDGKNRYSFVNDYAENELEDLEGIVNNRNISIDNKIELFYAKLNSSILDIFRIVADYNSLYIINGEGLLIHVCMLLSKFYCFENEEDKNILTFNNCLNVSSVIYYMEKVLNDFSLCNSNFHILFFNVFDIFFEKGTQIFENYNLMRNAFIVHCKKNLIPYFIFDNWYNDNNYDIYLIKYKPLFMFVEDSSSFLYAFNKIYVSPTENVEYNGEYKGDGTEEKKQERERNYKEYALKKSIHDYYNEGIRELSICLYFLLINNILRDIKCVFFFNLETEKNTINAFSINYKGLNFSTLEKLNEESSSLFDAKLYERNEVEEKAKNKEVKEYQSNNMLLITRDVRDYDLLYKKKEDFSQDELEMFTLFSKEIIKDNINLKSMVLKIFYHKNKSIITQGDNEKGEIFLFILKLLFMHNYLIEKLNMKNLCFYDSEENKTVLKFVKSSVDLHVRTYLHIYNFALKELHGGVHCSSLKDITNADVLNFFNASIIHNLMSFICFKLTKNTHVLEHEDFLFEDESSFETSFQNAVGDSLSLFPISFSFVKNVHNSATSGYGEGTEVNGGGIPHQGDDKSVDLKKDSTTGQPIGLNMIRIRNEFVETFFHLKDTMSSAVNCRSDGAPDEGKIQVQVTFAKKRVEYNSEFFDQLQMMHISDREEVMDVYRSYVKLSESRNFSMIKNIDEKRILRNTQKEEKRKAIITKYFYVSSLHHPIIISENHPWLKYYMYSIEKLFHYLKDEGKKKGIMMRMKRVFHESSSEDEFSGNYDQKKNIKKNNKRRVKIFEVLDETNEGSELDSEDDPEKMHNKEENKKARGGKVTKKNIKTNTQLLSRKDEILKKKEMTNEKKVYEVDLERYSVLEAKINKLCSNNNYSEMNTWSLDIISGFNRLVDVYNFNNVTNLIKSVDLQIKVSMKVLSSMYDIIMYTKLKNVKSSKQKSDAIRSVMLIYKLTNEIFNKFKENLSEKDIVQLQTVLLSLGFKNSSYNLFEEYAKIRLKREMDSKNDDEEVTAGSGCKKGKAKEKSKGKDIVDKKKGNVNEAKGKGKEKEREKSKKKGKDGSDDDHAEEEKNARKNEGKKLKEIYKYKIDAVKTYSELKIDEKKEHEFQLYYMYYLLDRTTGNIKDSRVLFTLDTWQYNILNLVDRRKSILVSCPTSSGKTFICYYVMDKVLRLNNDSVVVYVAPNDTLALQVYHEVNGRFSTKGYSKYSANKLCSFLTDKHTQTKALEAQIIIILPSVLENILLSYYAINDASSQGDVSKFISRIEYIIFDEIHCIGDTEFYGTQLENIIHLTNCPFLALSATIGNIKYFYSWLQALLIKKGKGENFLHLIKFYERFSDLILYVYTNRNLHHLNPLACYNYRDILYKGINNDFYCNPRETYEIIIVLFELARKKDFYHLIEFLEPSFYFQFTRCINKKQFIYYMHSVKEMIVYLIQNKYITSSDYDMFIHILLSNYLKNTDGVKEEGGEGVGENRESEMEKRKDMEEEKKEPKQNQSMTKQLYVNKVQENIPKQQLFQELYKKAVLNENYYLNKSNDLVKYTETVNAEQEYLDSGKLIELLKKLENINFLPCIVFNFERKELEDMTINLVNELVKMQHDKYYGDDERTFNTKMENKRRQERYESLLKQREMLLKIKTVSRNQRIEQNLDKDYLDMLNEDEIPEPPIDISEEYDGDFYFCNRKVYHNYIFEIEDLIKDAERAIEGRKNKSVLIEGLKRGIGLHYEVLPYRFTIIVESLFRLGYIKIIFSNKNLSLGINIPCKSIIFAGHTYELNSLMFKQTSGRAGRRGFDLYGNIIIWNINFKNVKRLITSPLQTLSGSYAVNFTNICRCMLLYSCLKKLRDTEETNWRNKFVINKPNKKKKKDETMSIAEKEEIFEKNRSININYYSRINGILSMFYNSLYYINAFHSEHNKNTVSATHEEGAATATTEIDGTSSDEYVLCTENEFEQFKVKDIATKYVSRQYEYNELICEFISNGNDKKRKSINMEKSLKELSFMIKVHFHIYINILVEIEALDEECNIINLTELSIFLKKECDNNLLLTYLLIKKVVHNIVGDNTFLASASVNMIPLHKIVDCITYEKGYSRNIIVDDLSRGQFILLFVLSHFVNKIKENKIALTNILINYNNKNRNKLELFSFKYFPLLHALPTPIQKHINHIESIILKYFKSYCLIVMTKLNLWNKKKTYLLPYTQLYIFEQHPFHSLGKIFPQTDSAYLHYYQEKVRDCKIRSPFLACLYKHDNFSNLSELLYTSLLDLDIRRNMIPDIMDDYISFYKFEDGLTKEEKICLKNSYMLDYYMHGKHYILRNKNRLGQYTWYIIDRFLNSLKNIEHFFYEIKKEKLLLSEDVFYTCLNTLKDVLEKYFKSINSA